MATGDSDNIRDRVKRVIPRRWFNWAAATRDGVIGGLADLGAWCYSWVTYARLQSRLLTATDIWLDILCYDFLGRHLLRHGLTDDLYRRLIKATILQERVTRAGMINAVTTLTGNEPWIFEPWNTYDTGAYSGSTGSYGSMGYGVGRGGYGNMDLPGQVFMQAVRGASSGVPQVTGYGGYSGGYAQGAIEYAGSWTRLEGVTDEMIENLIVYTKPTGVTVWLYIH